MVSYAKIELFVRSPDELRVHADPQHVGVILTAGDPRISVFFSHECARAVRALADELDRMAALCDGPDESE